MNDEADLEVIAETRHLRFVRRDGWEYVTRQSATGVVCIIAVTPGRELLFVEQYRPPVRARMIEFPAGLAGDAGEGDEAMEAAAQRELREETGYEAGEFEQVCVAPSSAGLTDELITFFLAHDLRQVSAGGGIDAEQITVHHVPLDTVDEWLGRMSAAGRLIDARVYTGLYLLVRRGERRGPRAATHS